MREFTQADMRESMRAFSLDSVAPEKSEAVRQGDGDPGTLDTQEENRMDLGVAFQWLYLRENSLMQDKMAYLKDEVAAFETKSKNIKLGASERMAWSDRASGIQFTLTQFGDVFTEAAARISTASPAELTTFSPEQGRVYFQLTKKHARVSIATPAVTVQVNRQVDPVVFENTRRAMKTFEDKK